MSVVWKNQIDTFVAEENVMLIHFLCVSWMLCSQRNLWSIRHRSSNSQNNEFLQLCFFIALYFSHDFTFLSFLSDYSNINSCFTVYKIKKIFHPLLMFGKINE